MDDSALADATSAASEDGAGGPNKMGFDFGATSDVDEVQTQEGGDGPAWTVGHALVLSDDDTIDTRDILGCPLYPVTLRVGPLYTIMLVYHEMYGKAKVFFSEWR